ncbi:hypothetical protein ACIBG0_20905 [Nocardia sp. NPDC050630]
MAYGEPSVRACLRAGLSPVVKYAAEDIEAWLRAARTDPLAAVA